MKKIIFTMIVLFGFNALAHNHVEHEFDLETDTDESVLTPEGEALYYEMSEFDKMLKGVFPQTKWRECNDLVSGNYTGYRCSNNRGISKILKNFIDTHFLRCANEGLKKSNGKRAIDLHVTHDGIQGDANHSPRSLHAEARAIDVDSFVVTYSGGGSERFSFSKAAHQTFFNTFRECWGSTVNQYNGCPLYSGSRKLTGSIGKEDRNHQKHVHVSVPYCVGGRYSGNYFQR